MGGVIARLGTKRGVLSKLRALANRLERPPRSRDLHDAQLYRAVLFHFKSISAARRAAGVAEPNLRKRWTSPEVIVAELVRVYELGVRMTVTGLAKAGHRSLANAAIEQLGGMSRARLLAGIPEPERLDTGERESWDEERVTSEIQDRIRSGESVAARDVDRKLRAAGGYYFGNWDTALEAANLDPNEIRLVRCPYEPLELLDALRTLAKSHPEMTLASLHRHKMVEAWIREFQSIEGAARAAGLMNWPQRLEFSVLSRDATLANIERFCKSGEMSRTRVEVEEPALLYGAERHFGSWQNAVLAADLPYQPGKREAWTKAEILSELKARRDRGDDMSASALRREHNGLYQAAKKYLGGYSQSVEAQRVGAVTHLTQWSKEKIINDLQALNRGGHPIRTKTMGTLLVAACYNYFGSVQEARDAAGVPAPEPEWTKERVISEIRNIPKGEKPGRNLVSAGQFCFGKWRDALKAAGASAQTRERWTRPQIIAMLRKRYMRGLAMNTAAVLREDQSLYFAVVNHLGRPFGKVIARYTSVFDQWTEEDVLGELKELEKSLGRRPQSSDLPSSLVEASRCYWGGIRHAPYTRKA